MKPINLKEYKSLGYCAGRQLSEESRQIDKMLESFLSGKHPMVEIEEGDVDTFDLSSSLLARLAANKIRNRIRTKEEWLSEIMLSKRENRLFLIRRD